jgi:hypothetical protein
MFSIYRNQAAATPLIESWEVADASLREAILEALCLVEQQLSRHPQEQGESRGDGVRILFQAPLGVLFTLDDHKKLVHILRCWAFRTKPKVADDHD